MTQILCYGDSNTWGQIPFKEFRKARHPRDIRWPGHLQILLEENYHIIEEGLNGRTTGPEDPVREGRNGLIYLQPCLDSHVPLDLVIIMLGSNDLKKKFDPTPASITARMRYMIQLIQKITTETSQAQILLVAPGLIKKRPVYEDYHYAGLEEINLSLISHYEKMATEEKIHFLNATSTLVASENDGLHFEADVHINFAKLVQKKIDVIFGGQK